jgi:hypothetical protein
MQESGHYVKKETEGDLFNIHREFYKVPREMFEDVRLF